MHAIDTERSPGSPSLIVTTRRRLMPHGTSCSFLQAVTQALHSMQRSASHRNFIRAIASPPSRRFDLAQCHLRLLHSRCRIVAVGRDRVGAFAEHDRIGVFGIVLAQIYAAEPAAEMERHPGDALADAFGHERLHLGLRAVLGTRYPHPDAILDAPVLRIRRVDFNEHLLLQRVSSPPPSNSTSRPELRISGNSFAIPLSIAAFCAEKPMFGSLNCLASGSVGYFATSSMRGV